MVINLLSNYFTEKIYKSIPMRCHYCIVSVLFSGSMRSEIDEALHFFYKSLYFTICVCYQIFNKIDFINALIEKLNSNCIIYNII